MCAMQTNTRMRSTKNTLPVVKDFLLADGYHAQNLLQLYKKKPLHFFYIHTTAGLDGYSTKKDESGNYDVSYNVLLDVGVTVISQDIKKESLHERCSHLKRGAKMVQGDMFHNSNLSLQTFLGRLWGG